MNALPIRFFDLTYQDGTKETIARDVPRMSVEWTKGWNPPGQFMRDGAVIREGIVQADYRRHEEHRATHVLCADCERLAEPVHGG